LLEKVACEGTRFKSDNSRAADLFSGADRKQPCICSNVEKIHSPLKNAQNKGDFMGFAPNPSPEITGSCPSWMQPDSNTIERGRNRPIQKHRVAQRQAKLADPNFVSNRISQFANEPNNWATYT
jgi:hypothetical protein